MRRPLTCSLAVALLLALGGCDDPSAGGTDTGVADSAAVDRGARDAASDGSSSADMRPDRDGPLGGMPDASPATDAALAVDAEPAAQPVEREGGTCGDIARCAAGCVGLPADTPRREACLASCVVQGAVASRDDYLALLQCAAVEGCGPPSDLPESVACVSERCEAEWVVCGYEAEEPPPESLNCVEFGECLAACGDDVGCRRGCTGLTPSWVQLAHRELTACASHFECARGDAQWDNDCMDRYCAIARRRCDSSAEVTCAQAMRCRSACPSGNCPGCMPAPGAARDATVGLETCITSNGCHDDDTFGACIRERCADELEQCGDDTESDCAHYDRCPAECRGEPKCIALCETFASPAVVRAHAEFEACRRSSGCREANTLPTRQACLQRVCLSEVEACYGDEFELYCGGQLSAMMATAGLVVDWNDEGAWPSLEDWWSYIARYPYETPIEYAGTLEPFHDVMQCVRENCPAGRCTLEQLGHHCPNELHVCNALNGLGACPDIIEACGTRGSREDDVCSWGADPEALSVFDTWRTCRQYTCGWNDVICAQAECPEQLAVCEGSTCLGLALCLDGCERGDSLCSMDCLAAAREDAVGRYSQLVACNLASGCDNQPCEGRACAQEFETCFGWRPDGLNCNALDLSPATCDRTCQAELLRVCIEQEACFGDEACRLDCMRGVVNCVGDWQRDGDDDAFVCPLYDECMVRCDRYDAQCHASCRHLATDTCMVVEGSLDYSSLRTQSCRDVASLCEAQSLCRDAAACHETCEPLEADCLARCESRTTAVCAARHGCLEPGTHELLCLPEVCASIFGDCIDPPVPLDCAGFGACIERCTADCIGECECARECADLSTPAAPDQWSDLADCMRRTCERISGPEDVQGSVCAAIACDEELQACLPAPPDVSIPPAPPTCAEINGCLQACPAGDLPCGRACVSSTSAAEREAAGALFECARDQNTIALDSMAIVPTWSRARCAAEFTECFGPPLDCHGLQYCLDLCERPACDAGCLARARDDDALSMLAALADECGRWLPPSAGCLHDSATAASCYGPGLDCGEYLECCAVCDPDDARCRSQCLRRHQIHTDYGHPNIRHLLPMVRDLGACAGLNPCQSPDGGIDPVCLKLACPELDPWLCVEHIPEEASPWRCVDMRLRGKSCPFNSGPCLDEAVGDPADPDEAAQRVVLEAAYACLESSCGAWFPQRAGDCVECRDELEACYDPAVDCAGLDECLARCDGRAPCESRCIARAALAHDGWPSWHELWSCASERCETDRTNVDHACARRECAAEFAACFGDVDPAVPAAACGDVDFLGMCRDNVAVWCAENRLQEVDCADLGQLCGWLDDGVGHFCLDEVPEASPDPEPPLDCATLLACRADCLDMACVAQCMLRGDEPALTAYLALDACANAAGCPFELNTPIDEACARDACQDAFEGCAGPIEVP